MTASHVIQSNLDFNEISESECYIRGSLRLIGGFHLYIAEYVVTEPEIKRLKYRYHLQTSGGDLVVRWDNALLLKWKRTQIICIMPKAAWNRPSGWILNKCWLAFYLF